MRIDCSRMIGERLHAVAPNRQLENTLREVRNRQISQWPRAGGMQ